MTLAAHSRSESRISRRVYVQSLAMQLCDSPLVQLFPPRPRRALRNPARAGGLARVLAAAFVDGRALLLVHAALVGAAAARAEHAAAPFRDAVAVATVRGLVVA